jgi:transcription-repair coupling factor (superfamily II helicase)
MAEEDELKIEIHKLINTIDNKRKFNMVKSELEDRFGKLNEDVIIYMYSKWFDNLCKKLHINTIHETRNFTEIVFSRDILELLDVEEIFVFSVKLSDRFKFMSRGNDMVIVLNTIRIDKHPVYYLVDLLDGIYTKYYNNIM